MKTKLARVISVLAFTVSLAAGAWGQQAPLSDDELIEQYRSDIRLMLDNTPSPGAPEEETYRNSLLGLRRKLRDLLVEKRGALKSRMQNLRAGASAEVQAVVGSLASTLERVNGEVDAIDRALGQGDAAAAPGRPAADAAPNQSVLSKDDRETLAAARRLLEGAKSERAAMRAASERAVGSITDEQLEEAAAPPEVAGNELPAARCVNGMPVNGSGDSARPGSRYEMAVCTLARNIVLQNRQKRVINLSGDATPLFGILVPKLLKTVGDASYVAFVTEAQERRTDQQLGAGPSGGGATSLVSKGGIPYLFSFAVENGAATRTQGDTGVTFRFNPAGALQTLANRGFITGFRQTENDALLKFLRKTSVGLTFDTSRGDNAGAFTGDRQQLSEVNVKFEFVNERDPRHRKYQREWERFMAEHGVGLAGQIWQTTISTINLGGDEDDPAFTDPALQAWLVKTNEEIAAVDQSLGNEARMDAVAEVIRKRADLLPVDLVNEQTVAAISGFARQFKEYSEAKNRLLDDIAKGNVFTLEYTNKREVNASDTSNFRLIAAKGREVMGGRMDFTANGSLTLFHKRPAALTPAGPRAGRVRDFQFAGQVDVPFQVGAVGQFVFWFSGRYERLLEDAEQLNGVALPGTKGDIAVGQFGLRVPMPGTGLQLPISFTFANRTELVREKEVRGNFGFTFNLDSILARFKPF